MPRRPKGEGSIYQRADTGRWVAVLELDEPTTPGVKRQRKTFTAPTRREVVAKLKEAQRRIEAGQSATASRTTLNEFFTAWLDGRRTIKESTRQRYRSVYDVHLLHPLGLRRLTDITPEQIDRLYTSKLKAGFSPSSVRIVHKVLHLVLNTAWRRGLLARNPVDLLEMPKVVSVERPTLSIEQVRELFAVVAGTRYEALYVLLLTTGLRLGEALALEWAQLDLDGGSVAVDKTVNHLTGLGAVVGDPKRPASRRSMYLPTLTVDVLRRHWQRQEQRSPLVFPSPHGTYTARQAFYRASWHPLREQLGLGTMHIHDLRHSAASFWVALGIHPRVVADMLGHSTMQMTGHYMHSHDEQMRDASAKLGDLLSDSQRIGYAEAH